MKRVLAIVVGAAAVVVVAACGGAKARAAAEVKVRAQAFGELLLGIHDLDEEQAKSDLAGFIEPSPGFDERVDGYWEDFNAKSEMFRIVDQEVEKVAIGDSGTEALVRYRTTAEAPDGSRVTASQDTRWVFVEEEWYRSLDPPSKKLRSLD